MTSTQFYLYGVDETGPETLSPAQLQQIDAADLVIADSRFHAALSDCTALQDWPKPFSQLAEMLTNYRGSSVVMLATGDPLWYGAGRYLLRHFGREQLHIEPGVSGLQFAAARMGWPLESVQIISLHGRPESLLSRSLYPRARLMIIPQSAETARTVARRLCAAGWGAADITALSSLGHETETRLSASAEQWDRLDEAPADFHILCVDLSPAGRAGQIAPSSCLPDEAFITDGKMTKFEARSAALSRLMPHPGGVLIDLGCGTGSVSIEWLRFCPEGAAYAVDTKQERLDLAMQNADQAGVHGLTALHSECYDALDALPEPDAIFIGGGLSADLILAAKKKLPAGGRLVAHAVTVQSEALLLAAHQQDGGMLVRIQVNYAQPVGEYHGWRGLMPVTQYIWHKGGDA